MLSAIRVFSIAMEIYHYTTRIEDRLYTNRYRFEPESNLMRRSSLSALRLNLGLDGNIDDRDQPF